MPESELPSSGEARTPFTPAPAIQQEPFGDRREASTAPVKPVREGLPSTYRMRADSHYVDQLTGRSSTQTIHLLNVKTLRTTKGEAVTPSDSLVASIRRHNVLQPLLVQRQGGRYRIIDGQKRLAAAVAAGIDEVPCLLHDVDDSEAAALAEAANAAEREQSPAVRPAAPAFGDTVADSLADVATAADLMSRSGGALTRLAALNLINAEMWRAECLLDGTRLVDGKRRIANSLASPIRIIESVKKRMTAEARLRSAQLEARTSDVPAATHVYSDEELVVRALSLLAISTLAWMENAPDGRMIVRAALRGTRSVTFEVFQDSVVVPGWFSTITSATDYIGVVPAAVWLLGARQIAEALNAHVSVTSPGAVGSVMGFTLPVAKE